MDKAQIARMIDHTILKAEATEKEVLKLCKEAVEYNFASVCINPSMVPVAATALEGTDVEVCTVIGFPLGMNKTIVKEYEAISAIEDGATEIDMVMNVGAFKDKDYDYVKQEIENVRDAIDGKVLKVIIETSLLTDEEIIKATEICNETFVNFIKTSTGFGKRGASVHDIELINEHKSEVLEIKASGGIKTEAQAHELITAGATRIGTSSGVELMRGE